MKPFTSTLLSGTFCGSLHYVDKQKIHKLFSSFDFVDLKFIHMKAITIE